VDNRHRPELLRSGRDRLLLGRGRQLHLPVDLFAEEHRDPAQRQERGHHGQNRVILHSAGVAGQEALLFQCY